MLARAKKTFGRRCTICASYFKGIIAEKPPENSRVLMECKYVGNFDQIHSTTKKRRLIGPTFEKAVSLIINEGVSCETFREREAVRLMKEDDSIDFILSPIHHDNIDEPIDTYLVVSSNSIHQNNSTNYSSGCPLYNSGDFPSKNGSHKCNKCHVPVNALLSCSTHKQGQDEIRYCLKCSKDDDEINAAYLSEEHKSVEGWNRKPKRQRNLNSYLCPNPNLRHLQINNSKNIQSLPLLKNGSRAQELKSCTITNIGKVILSNTCAFDTISSILMSWLIMVSVQKHIQKELN
ncbi:hypothetical protein ACI65C_012880 [Semiaphis heraclei]